jgi:hypothetical protein
MCAFWMGQSLAFPKDLSNWLTGEEFSTKSKMPIAPELISPEDSEYFRKILLIYPAKQSHFLPPMSGQGPVDCFSGIGPLCGFTPVQIDVQAGFHIMQKRCHSVLKAHSSSAVFQERCVATERTVNFEPLFRD